MIRPKLSALTVSALAAALILLAFASAPPTTARAAKGGNGGGGGSNETQYDVTVVDHGEWPLEGPAGPYLPDCPGITVGTNFAVRLPDEGDAPPTSCAVVYLEDEVRDAFGNLTGYIANGYTLRDNLGFSVSYVKQKGKSYFYSVTLHGQEDTGPDSSWHETREMVIEGERVPVPETPQEIILHVHKTVPVEIYNSHLDTGGNQPIEVKGWISVGDLIYTPQPQQ